MPSEGMTRALTEVVLRATLPLVMFVPDVALALQVTPATARRAILAGRCGPYSRIGRRLVVRRDALLAAIAEREVGAGTGALP